MKRYYPILLSKPGELIALSHLSNSVKSEITPIIEVVDRLADANGYNQKLQETFTDLWSFDDNQLFLDFSLYPDVNGDISYIRRLFINLLKNGVNVVPVVMFTSEARYLALVQTLISNFDCDVCIRENNNGRGFINFNTELAAILAQLNTTPANSYIVIDLGFSETGNYNLLITVAHAAITALHNINDWKEIIVASGSFLPDLGSLAAPVTNTSAARVYRLQRFEWDIWTILNGLQLPREVKYGDYGTKHPYYLPAAFEGSCSIKYTTTHEYVIYRGRKASDHSKGGNQYNDSARSLIASADYYGQPFSWGDEEIFLIGNRKDKPGNAGKWVQISQNHHITTLHQLL